MNDEAVGADTPPETQWACVEIFGHRKHYGRVWEVERFGTKMLRVDVPSLAAAPLLGEDEQFDTFFYGGAAILSFMPMTEEAARKLAGNDRPFWPVSRLPAPAEDREEDWRDRDFDDEEY